MVSAAYSAPAGKAGPHTEDFKRRTGMIDTFAPGLFRGKKVLVRWRHERDRDSVRCGRSLG